jgi:hypothetical protein
MRPASGSAGTAISAMAQTSAMNSRVALTPIGMVLVNFWPKFFSSQRAASWAISG